MSKPKISERLQEDLKNVTEILTKAQNEAIRLFCEQVNDLACENMLQPPYKLEGQHKRAMVIICKQMGIKLTFEDEK